MNKRTIIALCTIGITVVVSLTALLIGKNRQYAGADVTLTTVADQAVAESGVQQDASAATDFTVVAGVGNKKDWDSAEMPEGSLQNTMETQGRQDTPTTQPSQGETNGTARGSTAADDGMPDVMLTYEAFIRMSEDEQDAYFLQFEDPRDYAAWLKAAKQAYENNQTAIVITGPVDLSTLPVDGD